MTENRFVEMTRMEIPDYSLGFRGKILRRDKAQPGSSTTFCTIMYGMSHLDDVSDNSFSSATNGYPDRPIVFDEETRVDLPWSPGLEAVIGDLVDMDGRPFEASPRGALQKILARYEALELTPVLGYEFEFWIFHNEDRHRPNGVTEGFGRQQNAYSLQRLAEAQDLIREFMWRMDKIGIKVEAFHSELGPGLFEFTLAPEPALRAADNATRAKQYMRELCQERGLAASFMAKPHGDESGAGGHVHSSLMQNNKNIFSIVPGELSELAKQYVAGLIETMPDFMALFAPYVNSYKRVDPTQYVANTGCWAVDDRSASCRVLLGSVSAARVEHRVSGADTSPYFSALGILAGGLYGIENKLKLEESNYGPVALPESLEDSVLRFRESSVARKFIGAKFIEAASRVMESEVRDYKQSLRQEITSWERSRHLEHH